jgi:hypothetical protein
MTTLSTGRKEGLQSVFVALRNGVLHGYRPNYLNH